MKCISVVDTQGNSYEATYPKRAKGLVKHGRARFVNEYTICLTCPPHNALEETHMMTSDNMTNHAPEITAAQIFEELQKIRQDTAHISLAMEKLEKVPTGGDSAENVCKEKIAAILKIAEEREKTNQALIHLYERMYDDVYYDTHESALEASA